MSNIYIVLKCKKSKLFYEILNKNTSNTAGKTKWDELFEINDKEWKIIHKIPFKVSKDSKLKWF
jgi:hypothetical protein